MKLEIRSKRIFWMAMIGSILPMSYIMYEFSDGPMIGLFQMLLWNTAPLLIAIVLFLANARHAAWGWLIGVTLLNCLAVAAVLLPPRDSMSGLVFLWVPVWNFMIVGPVGALIGVLASRPTKKRPV